MQVTQGSHTSKAWSLREPVQGQTRSCREAGTASPCLRPGVHQAGQGIPAGSGAPPLTDGCLELRFLLPRGLSLPGKITVLTDQRWWIINLYGLCLMPTWFLGFKKLSLLPVVTVSVLYLNRVCIVSYLPTRAADSECPFSL